MAAAKPAAKKGPTKKGQVGQKEHYSGKYPSPFGSHASMISQEWTEKLADPTLAVLEDDNGLYVTERKQLDSRLADPYRNTLADTRANLLTKAFAGAKVAVVRKDEKVFLAVSDTEIWHDSCNT